MSQSKPSVRGWTSVSVRRETYRRMKSLKRGGESFDELLTRLIDERYSTDQYSDERGNDE